ncbi:ribosomal L7Ae/L30e/S12e/Gadd45 family protein [Candidatus Woesearchaeota archaeon]|nr:ribosomal L7Ae/L30e/S12e/Gadd45 family protein [Candidatus Woesearchaeota archaeon]
MIKDAIATKRLLIGAKSVIDGLRKKKLSRVVLAKNCSEGTKNDIAVLAKLSGIEVSVAEQLNDELGILCKKPFSISALGFLKV